LQMISSWFTVALQIAMDFVMTFVIPMLQIFWTMLSQAWTLVSPGLLQLSQWFIVTLGHAIKFVDEVLVPIIQGFIDLILGIWETVQPAVTALVDGFFNQMTRLRDNVINPAIEWVQGLLDKINEALDLFGRAQEAAQAMQGIGQNARAIGDAARENNVGAMDVAGIAIRETGKGIRDAFRRDRDTGGSMTSGVPYRIDEPAGGFEVFAPNTNGNMITAEDLAAAIKGGGSGGNTINVTVHAPSGDGATIGQEIFRELTRLGADRQ
jgi:hypothetical protein